MLQENLLSEPDFYCDLLQFYFSFNSKEDSVSTKASVSFCNSHDQQTAQRTKGKQYRLHFCPWILLTKVQLKPASSFPLSVSLTAFPFLLLPQGDGGGTHGQRSNRNNLLLLLLSRHHGKISSLLPPSSFPKKLQGTQYHVIKAAGREEEKREKKRRESLHFFYSSRIQTPLLFSSSYSSPHKKRNAFTPRFLEQHDLFSPVGLLFPFSKQRRLRRLPFLVP